MRAAHFAAFNAALKAHVSALASHTFDGDAPLLPDPDGNLTVIRRETYLVEHDMGFDAQSDGRLSAPAEDLSDGTYRVIVRVVGTSRGAVRGTADAVQTGLVGVVLTITGRQCGPIQRDHGPDAIQRDDLAPPPLFYADLDFIWRSSRA